MEVASRIAARIGIVRLTLIESSPSWLHASPLLDFRCVDDVHVGQFPRRIAEVVVTGVGGIRTVVIHHTFA